MDKIIELQITEIEDKLGILRAGFRDQTNILSPTSKAKLSYILADILDDLCVLESEEEVSEEDDQ